MITQIWNFKGFIKANSAKRRKYQSDLFVALSHLACNKKEEK